MGRQETDFRFEDNADCGEWAESRKHSSQTQTQPHRSFTLLQFDSEAFENDTSNECRNDSSAILLIPYNEEAAGMLGGVVANRTP
jgi:hypothetical protein